MIEIVVGDFISSSSFNVGAASYVLHCFWATIARGEPVATEHQELAWVPMRKLMEFDLAPADIPIAKAALNHAQE